MQVSRSQKNLILKTNFFYSTLVFIRPILAKTVPYLGLVPMYRPVNHNVLEFAILSEDIFLEIATYKKQILFF